MMISKWTVRMPCLVAAYLFVVNWVIDWTNEAAYEFALNTGNSHHKSFIEMLSTYEWGSIDVVWRERVLLLYVRHYLRTILEPIYDDQFLGKLRKKQDGTWDKAQWWKSLYLAAVMNCWYGNAFSLLCMLLLTCDSHERSMNALWCPCLLNQTRNEVSILGW